jgi:hypothetical protein
MYAPACLFESVQCQQYMQGPTVAFAVGALHMLARALHLHRAFLFCLTKRVTVTAAALALCPCCLPVLCFDGLHLQLGVFVGLSPL